jgi:hypothetical protein
MFLFYDMTIPVIRNHSLYFFISETTLGSVFFTSAPKKSGSVH